MITFADLMRQSFRESDVFARIGGDEFAVLLTNTCANIAAEVVERFRNLVATHNREARRGYDISFSDGVFSLKPEEGCQVEDLLREADVMMYENKSNDRSPVCLVREA